VHAYSWFTRIVTTKYRYHKYKYKKSKRSNIYDKDDI